MALTSRNDHAPPTQGTDLQRNALNASWLIKLRWAAISGQITVIIVTWIWLSLRVPWGAVGIVLAAQLLVNLIAQRVHCRGEPIRAPFLAISLTADLLALTTLLYYLGGPHNPFSLLYIVYVALAAVVLQPAAAWTLGWIAVMLMGVLFYHHHELDVPGATQGQMVALLLFGAWVALLVASFFVIYFVQRVTRTLALQDRALVEARVQHQQVEHFVALSTLAAGAAHELATPLSTIAIAAREVERSLQLGLDTDYALEDVTLIREEVGRCHGILGKLSLSAANDDVHPEAIGLQVLVDRTLESSTCRMRSDVTCDEPDAQVMIPPELVVRILRTLIKNAIDASSVDQRVDFRAYMDGDDLCFSVADHGTGMSPETLQRVGQPFFTTKGPGSGMGLGVFLTQALVGHVGGKIHYDSQLGAGTKVDVRFPAARVRPAGTQT